MTWARRSILFGEERVVASATGLIVFDMLECYREPIEAAGTLPNVLRLLVGCRKVNLPVFFARADHRSDGRDLALTVSDTDASLRAWEGDYRPPRVPPYGSGSDLLLPLRELAMSEQDFDIPKHRWSAFHGTALDTTLRALGISTVLIVGGSTHVGVASTVYGARDMDYQVTVVRDGCHGFVEQKDFFLNKVFPRICKVRTTSEVISNLVP